MFPALHLTRTFSALLGYDLLGPTQPAGIAGLDWVVKSSICAVTAFVLFFLIFFVIYPTVLRSAKMMPLTLYGVWLGVWLSLWLALSLFLFWDQLLAGNPSNEINLWPRAVGVLVWALGTFLPPALVRSRKKTAA